MEFTVEFYETIAGRRPVEEFLLRLKASDPHDFAAVTAGLEKLRHRQYHREPLSKALGDPLFELRHVGKLNTRVLWFFRRPSHRRCAPHPKQRPANRCAPPSDRSAADGRWA